MPTKSWPAFVELESASSILASTTPAWLRTQPRSRGTTKVLLDSQVTGHNPTSNRSESENGNVVKENLIMLFRRFVLFVRSVGGKFGKAVKEKLARNVSRNRPNNGKRRLRLKLEWPYVMNSSLAMHRPFVSGTWIWHRQHACWHHGYYRTRR